MGINAKTNNKNINFIFFLILFKLFLDSIAIKNIHIYQKISEYFLPTAKFSTAQKSNLEGIMPSVRAEMPTKVWIAEDNDVRKKSIKKNRQNLKENKFAVIKLNNKLKTRAIAKFTKSTQAESFQSEILLTNPDWKQELVDNFASYLYRLKPVQKELISKAYKLCTKRKITIASSFKISKQGKKHLQTAVRENIIKNARIKFKINSSLHKKIELKDWGYKISWDLKYYLTELDRSKDKVLVRGIR